MTDQLRKHKAKTLTGATAQELDAAYEAWRDTLKEQTVVSRHFAAAGNLLALHIVYTE
ncbi:MAG TPA: hypothetical protein VFX29_05295 [Longimicrobiaceae bacterium]|nr:hypothetical protein [Longimicrobiaceae bacterium]